MMEECMSRTHRRGRFALRDIKPGHLGADPFGAVTFRWPHSAMSQNERARDEKRMLRMAKKTD